MKQKHFLLASTVLCSGLSSFGFSQSKPNVLFILIDDMGYPATECYGNKYVKTPNINSIASSGMLFKQAYVCPQSTPTRASLLTGQYTARNKMWHVVPYYGYPNARLQEPTYLENMPREQFTMAEALKTAGYTTAMIGKWHLSTYDNDGYYSYLYQDKAKYYGFDYVVPLQNPKEYNRYTDEGVGFLTNTAINFMRRNNKTPWFIYLSHFSLHQKVLAPDSLIQKYLRLGFRANGIHNATYLAAIEHLDNSIGLLLSEIKKSGNDDNTIIYFVSDNGGVDYEFDNAPLRAGKGSAYEGGIRVPFMIKWPQKIKQGTTCDKPVHIVDVYPTILEMAGIKNPTQQILDGKSIVPLLRQNKSAELKFGKRPVYFYQPLYDPQWGAVPSASIIQGDFKLIWFFGDYIHLENDSTYIPTGRIELYNLKSDLSESTDLSAIDPHRTKAMKAKLLNWIKSSGAEIPKVNPNYIPAKWDVINTSKKEE